MVVPSYVGYSIFYSANAIYYFTEYILVEDPFPFDGAPQRASNIGKPSLDEDFGGEREFNHIRVTDKYFPNTQINGLGTFRFENKFELTDKYGKIQALEQLGSMLVTLCERKIFSAGIGYSELYNADGTANMSRINQALGYFRPHAEDYGCQTPHAIVNTGRYIYFVDKNRREVVRKASNGLQTISGDLGATGYNFKMDAFFDDYLAQDGDFVTGYDPANDLLYVARRAASTFVYGAIFDEPSNRWISMCNMYGTIPQTPPLEPTEAGIDILFNSPAKMFSAFTGDIYDHSYGTSFYGVAPEYSVTLATNANSNFVHVFNDIEIHGTIDWEASEIKIPATLNNRKMLSRIKNGKFDKEEGVMRAPFMRNALTSTSVDVVFNTYNSTNIRDLHIGDLLRGHYMTIKLVNSDTKEGYLFKVNVDSELSR